MPGVLRPYTLVDVIGTINGQNNADQGTTDTAGLGDFAETDEATSIGDSMAGTIQTNPVWDAGYWGSVIWG